MNNILNSGICDILFLNEIKLDDSNPDKLFEHDAYNMLRRNRNKAGGGIMVYVKKQYKLIDFSLSSEFELIFFKIMLNKLVFNFIAAYRPPNEKEANHKLFFEHLDTFMHSFSLTNNIFIVGDLNLDLFSKRGDPLKQFMSLNALKNAGDKPTRVAIRNGAIASSTLIDVVLHNTNLVTNANTIDFPFSDHKMVLVQLNQAATEIVQNFKLSRKLNKKNTEMIANEIFSIDFSILNSILDLNDRWFFFKKIILNVIDSIAPFKKVKLKRAKSLPWYDYDLINAERKCSKLYSKFKKSNFHKNFESAYLESRRVYQKLLRDKKIAYFEKTHPNDFDSSKDFCRFYSSYVMLKSSKANNDPSSIKINNESITDKQTIANEFNKFFSSFESERDVSVEDCKSFIFDNFRNNMSNRIGSTSFGFKKVTSIEVGLLIDELDIRTSPGASGIPTSIFKACNKAICPFLTSLFNDCIENGVFVDEFKLALVSPLLKKGDATSLNNYRGLSKLPQPAKIFEKLLSDQIKEFFVVNDLFVACQHGFRSCHSCESALHEIISKILSKLNNSRINLLLFVDFKKAFDMVVHDLLLYKLLNYGFDNNSIKLLKDYFTSRKQVVKIDGISSNLCDIELGVPQGSVLGPLLFIIFINDLVPYLNGIESILFADDTTNLFDADSLENTISSFKQGIFKLCEWCKHNKLYINWDKTFAMFISNKRISFPKEIQIDDKKIACVEQFKLLGVVIDNKLNFEKFVYNKCSSINRRLYSIKKLFFLPQKVKLMFFKSFVLPYFDYCSSLSIYFSQAAISKLNKTFYMVVFKLFRLKFPELNISQVNSALVQELGVNAFQYRLVSNTLTFVARMASHRFAPKWFKEVLVLKSNTNPNAMVLRSSRFIAIETERAFNKFGDFIFSNFCNKTFEILHDLNLNFYENFKLFKKNLDSNIHIIYNKISTKFIKFNLSSDFYYYQKKH
jgi:hypothetical protein